MIWKQEDASVDVGPCYWTVTRVRPEKVKRESVQVRINPILFFFSLQCLTKGKVWGTLTWRGKTVPSPFLSLCSLVPGPLILHLAA